jgi:hypothetical protein
MASHNVSSFASKVVKGGARPHLFEVTGQVGSNAGDAGELKTFLIKAAQLPASTLGIIEVPFRGRKVKIPGDRTFAEWTITVICDGDFKLRDSFEKWSNNINAHIANTSSDTAHQPLGAAQVYQDWQVTQFDRQQNNIKKFEFVGCWPSEVSAMEVNYETTDTIHEFTVTLQYTYWTSDRTTT